MAKTFPEKARIAFCEIVRLVSGITFCSFMIYVFPNPLHSGHAPCGELNENEFDAPASNIFPLTFDCKPNNRDWPFSFSSNFSTTLSFFKWDFNRLAALTCFSWFRFYLRRRSIHLSPFLPSNESFWYLPQRQHGCDQILSKRDEIR